MKLSHIKNIKKSIYWKRINPKTYDVQQATFKPNDFVEPHSHNTMFEVYYIKKGKAEFTINDKKHVVKK